ncbi:putative amidohydrolase YtcJ [Pelomonas saccharophila]|uniref:Amidohydrolase YtcJ n=1 Tax=Roseateles saccharophilus TaxID=304 RepID=A0ABU1YKV3_ROSSA|nr:amidohydrolase [Roseateles saccharophilus]MDR7269489.1 putative amidohydrolase YtcJ [Roseateles saccharophilus]
MEAADLIVLNARIETLDRQRPQAEALAVRGGRFVAVGADADIMAMRGASTRVIDARGKRIIPGLIDSHIHLIRGGLNFNLELRWEGVPTLADAMAMLKEQVERTPAPQWVRVVGGFSEHQFAEKRLPTLDELNAVAPHTPVFILHLYDRALLNAAALRAVGYDKDTPNPPGGEIQRDSAGRPTGLLLARPNAVILYSALARGPKLDPADQINSTRLFMRELNRLGVTSVIDAGGGFQNYPEDYQIIDRLARDDELTIRIAYNLFTQNKGAELSDFLRWSDMLAPLAGSEMYRHNGAGEMLVFSGADFEDFREPRPEMSPGMEPDLEAVVRLLVQKRWPFRMHATYEETISRALDVFEKVNRDIPFAGLHWWFDHAETVSPRSIDRIKALGGGIAVQHRMAFQGEYFVARYGAEAARATPPVRRMLDAGLPVGAGTDATRVASYNPWTSLAWLVTGKTVGGMRMYGEANLLDRHTALRLWTSGNTWFSHDEGRKGQITPGQLADFALLSRDYFSVPEDEIGDLYAELTVMDGRVVHGSGDFSGEAPPLPPASPDWSPVNRFGGHWHRNPAAGLFTRPSGASTRNLASCCALPCGVHGHGHDRAYTSSVPADDRSFWGALGCACWAF